MVKTNPKLKKAYEKALKAGRGEKFLKNHPRFAQKIAAEPEKFGSLPKKIKKKLNNEAVVQNEQALKQIQYGNAQYNTDFGSTGVTFDENGNPVYTETSSDAQKGLLNQGQDLAKAGNQQAQNLMNNYQQFTQGSDPTGERSRIEDAVFDRMTSQLRRDYADRKGQLEQDMYNRGVAMDPNDDAYNKWMGNFQNSYGEQMNQAASQAVIQGGEEMQRNFNQGLQQHQQGMSDMSALQQQGIGYQGVQGPGYTGPQPYSLTNPNDLQLALKRMELEKQQVNIQQQLANKSLGGGGGGGGGGSSEGPNFLA